MGDNIHSLKWLTQFGISMRLDLPLCVDFHCSFPFGAQEVESPLFYFVLVIYRNRYGPARTAFLGCSYAGLDG